jgi:predicted metal-dependent enzyme (double-stranded beta helix superfamily)
MNSVKELYESIGASISNTSALNKFADELKQYQGVDWKVHVQFSEDTYARHLIFRHDLFEILLLCWAPGQSTQLHNHPEQGCVLKVLQGSLLEERYQIGSNTPFLTEVLRAGDIGYMNNTMGIHRVSNKELIPAVSLHVYAPAEYQAELFG